MTTSTRTEASRTDETGSLGKTRVEDVLLEIEQASIDAQAWFETDYGMGQVLFHQGKMVKARLGGARGLTALLRLLAIRDGRYGIKPCAVIQEPTIVQNVNQLIALHHTRQVEWRELCGSAPPLSSVLTLTSKGASVRDASRGVQRVILVLLDGRRTLMQVLEESSFDPVEALRIVTQGIQDELVQVAPQATSLFPLASAGETPGVLPRMAPVTPTMRMGSGPVGVATDSIEERKATLVGLGNKRPVADASGRGGLAPAPIIEIGSRSDPIPDDRLPLDDRAALTAAASSLRGIDSAQGIDRVADNPPGYVDRYEILLPLGRGELGTVYLARSTGGNVGFSRLYAVKLLHAHLVADARASNDFLQEAKIVSCLQHANIASIHDAGFHGAQPYLVMEYVEGSSFDQLTRNVTERSPYFILPIIIDALAGLQAAHSVQDEVGVQLNLVHGDISPESILVGVDGTSRLTGFGRARAMNQVLGARAKRKAGYRAPEQITGEAFDHRADIFSMGVVLWNALTAKPLFSGETAEGIFAQVRNARVEPPSALGAESYQALDDAVLRALSRDPNERFESAEEMLTVLGNVAATHGGLATCKEIASWVRDSAGSDLTQRRLAVLDASRRNTTIPPPSVSAPGVSALPLGSNGAARTTESTPRKPSENDSPWTPVDERAPRIPAPHEDSPEPVNPPNRSHPLRRGASEIDSIFYTKNDYALRAARDSAGTVDASNPLASGSRASRYRAQVLPWVLVALLAVAVSIVILVLMKTRSH